MNFYFGCSAISYSVRLIEMASTEFPVNDRRAKTCMASQPHFPAHQCQHPISLNFQCSSTISIRVYSELFTMDLVLREDPVPSGDTESEIRKNPKVCSTCWNLHPGSALWPAGLGIVSMHTESGAHNANRLAKTRDIGRPPAWAGEISRLDYTSFTFYAKLTDVHASALSCDTCRILVVAVTKLSEGKADWEDPLMQLDIVFCKDTVLWISLQRDNNQGEVDFSEVFSDLQQYDEPWTTELIATWDLYLLFGKFVNPRGQIKMSYSLYHRDHLSMAHYWQSDESGRPSRRCRLGAWGICGTCRI